MISDESGSIRNIEDGLDSPFSAAMAEQERNILAMVRRALDRKQTVLAYQPVVQANNPGKVAFYEGLVRVLDETGRIIPAHEFIGTIENTELGRIIDCLALEMGLKALASEPGLRLSINMSARSIGYQRWMKTLEQGLDENPTVGERLILEITESSAMLMPELVTTFMDVLQARGIAFALDDFGAGYTAFRYLKEFFFDIIKIDGQFIRGIANNSDNQVMTKALVSIAEHFEMFTVAESIENKEDLAFLQSIGVNCLQGYYFGAPTINPPWQRAESQNIA
ncbi:MULTISPECIES: EAL domain-containing protein [Halocynthiibacter]|uniref:EAL domain-containing protein n=1 Tax=Halocynthiibacter halioticoli TaxID=2986804 RepID=A0AAE3LPE6_9RHOB|nr:MULTISPECIES: EAL domain-containing protein [Halocynthiibacter]MCV6823287.1 EAL domain-containing protein [Halocynthiibacter halioticoli]MCW4056288.1 EAL domain-containing protein [Halocynthiibacter sp. SDUM655004]